MSLFQKESDILDDPRSILVVGGTFDPPHMGHIELALWAAQSVDCKWILFVPANRSPHKMDKAVGTDGETRLRMLQLTIDDQAKRDDDRHIEVSRYEIDHAPPSYTVNTLEAIRKMVGNDVTIRLLMGTDQILSFTRWKSYERILQIAQPAVLLREPYHTIQSLLDAGLQPEWTDWIISSAPLHPANATQIRKHIAEGKELPVGWVSPSVVSYIKEHKLYRQ